MSSAQAAVLRQGTFDQPEPTVISANGENLLEGDGKGGAVGPGSAKDSTKTESPIVEPGKNKKQSSNAKSKQADTQKHNVYNSTDSLKGKQRPKAHSRKHSTTSSEENRSVKQDKTTMSGKKETPANGEGGGSGESDALEDIGKNFIDRVDRTEKHNVELVQENKRLLQRVDDMERENRQLHNDNKQTHKDMNGLRDQVQSMKDVNDKLETDLKAADKKDNTAKLKRLEEENKSLKDTLKVTEEQDKKLVSECSVLRSEIEKLSKENAALDTEVKSLREKLNDSDKKKDQDLKKNEEEINKLVEEIKKLEDKFSKMETKYKKHEQDMKVEYNMKEEKYIVVVQEIEREINRLKDMQRKLKQERDILLSQNEKLAAEQSEKLKNSVDKEFMTELQKSNAQVSQRKEKAERELAKLKRDYETFKKDAEKSTGEQAFSQVKINEMTERIKQMKVNMSTMKDLLQERESHIDDLRIEVNDLRNNCNAFNKELAVLRTRHDDDVTYEKYKDIEGAHKKLLEENKRLRTVIARTNMEETSTASDIAELRVELEKNKERLGKANVRIKQMEKWMDAIFNDDKFDVVLRDGVLGRTSVSLPDIAMSEPPPSTRTSAAMKVARPYVQKKLTPRKDTYVSPRKDTFSYSRLH